MGGAPSSRHRVRRVGKESFALVPASVDLGKAVKERAEERKAA